MGRSKAVCEGVKIVEVRGMYSVKNMPRIHVHGKESVYS